MNNFINFARKFERGRLEQTIISQANKHNPNLEQYISAHRYPILPKIVVYSAASQSDSFINKATLSHLEYSPTTTSWLPHSRQSQIKPSAEE